MATIRLVASAYTLSNTSYCTQSDVTNMYTNTDSTTNGYFRGRSGRSSNSTYYAFLRGFNFSDVPSNATVTDFKVKIKAYRGSYQATGSSYRIRLASSASSSSAISNTTLSEDITTTSGGTVYEIPTGSLTWATLSGYGSNFSIEIPLRNSSTSSSNYPYVYIYGAEIEVTYTLPNPRTITSTLTGNGTINPSGAQTYYDGDSYTLTITPTNLSDTVTVKNNGTDVTSQLVPPGSGTATDSAVLGTYVLTSGGFNGSGATYFQGIVGNGYDTSSTTTSNYYSSGNGTIAVFTYEMPVNVPSGATITDCYVMVNGHAESTSQSAEYMCAQLYAGSTAISSELNFKSVGTSNSTQTIQATTLPTAAQCSTLKLQCRLGYYGGAINGATVFVTYSYSTDYYTYTYTVSGNATIAVTIGGASPVSVTGVSLNQHTATVEEGQTLQLTATVSPSDATDKSVTWASNNTSAATVSSSGLVTAVASGHGTTTITVTTTDGGYTDTCVITVSAQVTTEYVLASSLVPGKKYVVANGNTGSVYLMTNESGGSRQLVGVSATITNGKLYLNAATEARVAFDCIEYTSGNSITTTLKDSSNKYIYTDNSTGLRFYAPTTLDRFWHYNGTKFWQFKSSSSDGYSDTSSEYKYYLEVNSSNNFTDNHVSTTSIENSTLPAIYLFIPASQATEALYYKNGSSWVTVTKAYKKINGSWVQQTDLSNVFTTGVNYRKGN